MLQRGGELVAQLRRRLLPVAGRKLEGAGHQAIGLFADARVELADGDEVHARGAAGAGLRHEPPWGLWRVFAGEAGVEGCAKAVDIGAGVGAALRHVLFGWREAGRDALRRRHGGALLMELGEAEVDQDGHTVGGDFDVGGLNVTVDHRHLEVVHLIERAANVDGPA